MRTAEEIASDREALIRTFTPVLRMGAPEGIVSIKRRDLGTLCSVDVDALRATPAGVAGPTAGEQELAALRDKKARLLAEKERREIEALEAKLAAPAAPVTQTPVETPVVETAPVAEPKPVAAPVETMIEAPAIAETEAIAEAIE